MYAHTPNLPQRSRLAVFDNPEGFENWLLFSSDVAFTFRCKRWATALHFNLFVRSTIQIPANSQTQNLGLVAPGARLTETARFTASWSTRFSASFPADPVLPPASRKIRDKDRTTQSSPPAGQHPSSLQGDVGSYYKLNIRQTKKRRWFHGFQGRNQQYSFSEQPTVT